MKRLLTAAGLLLLMVAAIGWWRSDRRRIERALDRLENACEKDGAESALALLARTETILSSFAPGLYVAARPYEGELTDARAVAGAIHAYRSQAQRIRITDSERRLEIRPNDTAEMTAVFHLDGDSSGSRGRQSFRARMFWIEHDGAWKIREFEIVETLAGGGGFF